MPSALAKIPTRAGFFFHEGPGLGHGGRARFHLPTLCSHQREAGVDRPETALKSDSQHQSVPRPDPITVFAQIPFAAAMCAVAVVTPGFQNFGDFNSAGASGISAGACSPLCHRRRVSKDAPTGCKASLTNETATGSTVRLPRQSQSPEFLQTRFDN